MDYLGISFCYSLFIIFFFFQHAQPHLDNSRKEISFLSLIAKKICSVSRVWHWKIILNRAQVTDGILGSQLKTLQLSQKLLSLPISANELCCTGIRKWMSYCLSAEDNVHQNMIPYKTNINQEICKVLQYCLCNLTEVFKLSVLAVLSDIDT